MNEGCPSPQTKIATEVVKQHHVLTLPDIDPFIITKKRREVEWINKHVYRDETCRNGKVMSPRTDAM